jgi:predicted nucleic acid-binding protein
MDDIISALVHSAHFVPDLAVDHGDVPGDADDDSLVALAREWHAALVTGDHHLLDLPGMPAIITPRRFLDLLEA